MCALQYYNPDHTRTNSSHYYRKLNDVAIAICIKPTIYLQQLSPAVLKLLLPFVTFVGGSAVLRNGQFSAGVWYRHTRNMLQSRIRWSQEKFRITHVVSSNTQRLHRSRGVRCKAGRNISGAPGNICFPSLLLSVFNFLSSFPLSWN